MSWSSHHSLIRSRSARAAGPEVDLLRALIEAIGVTGFSLWRQEGCSSRGPRSDQRVQEISVWVPPYGQSRLWGCGRWPELDLTRFRG